MTSWIGAFLIIGLLAALLGFGGFADTSALVAKALALISLMLCAAAFIIGRRRRHKHNPQPRRTT